MIFSIELLLQVAVEDKVPQLGPVVMVVAYPGRMDKGPLMRAHQVLKRQQVSMGREVMPNQLLLARVVTARLEQRVVKAAEVGMAAHSEHVQMAVAPGVL